MKRFIGIDIIKVLAAFFVISVHFFLNTNYYYINLVGENLFFQTFFRWFFLISVPLFMLCTGYLQSKKQFCLKYYKGLLPVLGIYLFYSISSILVRTYYFDQKQFLFQWLYDIMNFQANPYSWYINMYIGLFLLIPFINLIYNNLKNKKEKIVLIMTVVALCGLPSFFNYMPIDIQGKKPIFFPDWWKGIYPLAYYFIGCYIKEYKLKINKILALILFVIVILIETFLTFYFSRGKFFVTAIGEYDSILVIISSFLFFIIFYDINIKKAKINKIISSIAALSLDIYLCSFIVDSFIYRYVMENIFKTNFQIIYWFIPIVGTIIISTVLLSFIRKGITNLFINSWNKLMKSGTSIN